MRLKRWLSGRHVCCNMRVANGSMGMWPCGLMKLAKSAGSAHQDETTTMQRPAHPWHCHALSAPALELCVKWQEGLLLAHTMPHILMNQASAWPTGGQRLSRHSRMLWQLCCGSEPELRCVVPASASSQMAEYC